MESDVDFFAGDDDRRLDTHNTRVVERAGDEYTAFEEARGYSIADVVVDEVLSDQEALAGNIGVHVAVACGDVLQLPDEVFAFLGSLLWNALFECDVDSRYRSGAGKRITTCCRGGDERVAVHDAPDFGRGHAGAEGHNAAGHHLCLGETSR